MLIRSIMESLESEQETDSSVEKDLRRQRLREFYHLTHVLFAKPERLILYKILKDYQKRHDIERLIIGLNLVLRTYTKLELLKYVRYFLWEGHIKEFDRLTKFHMRFRKRRRGKKASSSQMNLLAVPQVSDRGSVASTNTSGSKIKDVRVFTLVKDPIEDTIGFSIRGGSEHGLSIYISEIEEGSAAEKCGLQVGDKILEANNVSLKGVASSSAVKVLTGFSKVKLVVQRARKVPEWRLSREKTSWIDVHDRKLISGEFEECGITHHIRGLEVDDPERRVSLKFGKSDRTLGFNIRGGREYGLGIYVSKVDQDGIADKNGVRVGDQIIDVNGVPFDNITHANAVEVLKGKRHLILTLKDVGRFPAFKELYAEYTWSETQMRSASSMTGIQDIRLTDRDHHKSRSASDLFYKDRRPSALQSEIFLPADMMPSTSGEIRDGDDLDSLSDLDQEHWTHTNVEYTNNGYESDREGGHEEVVVHVDNIEDVTDCNQLTCIENVDKDADEEENHLKIKMHDYDNYIYAKVNKGYKNDTVTPTGTRSENLGVYDAVPIHIETDTDENKYKGISRQSNMDEEDHDYGEFTLREKDDVYTNNSSTKSEYITQTSVSGGLYSKVRDIGPPLYKSPNEEQRPGTLRSNDSSVNSLKSLSSNDSELIRQANQQTLQVREVNRNTSDNSDESDENPLASSSREYDLNQDAGISNIYESEKYERSKGKVTKGSYDINHEQLDLNNLEDRLRELQKRQANIGIQELNTLSPNTYAYEGSKCKPKTRDTVDSQPECHKCSSIGGLNIPPLLTPPTDFDRNSHFDIKRRNLQDLWPRVDDGFDSASSRKSTWKSIKSKIKGSLRMKPPRKRNLVLQKDKENSTSDVTLRRGLQAMVQNSIDDYNMATFIEAASKLLSPDEHENVIRNVKLYHDHHDLDRLVDMLLITLDTPEKIQLLREVRGIVYPLDIVRFDNRVNKYEIEAYQKLSMKLHLPLNHKQLKRPRKTIITTEIDNPSSIPSADVSLDGEAEDGHFHIRPLDQYEKQEDVVNILRSNVSDRLHNSQSKENDSKADSYLINGNSEVVVRLDELSEYNSNSSGDSEHFPGSTTVHLSKNKPNIGIDLYETNKSGQREVKVQRIDPLGAANDDSTIEVGMTLLAIDRHKVDGWSKEEVLAVLQKCYADKHYVSMKLVLHKHQSTDL